jgi:hypothetical protein
MVFDMRIVLLCGPVPKYRISALEVNPILFAKDQA